VSHELKTPIALIQGYAEGLKDGVADDKESMEFYCGVIADEAEKMNRLVKSLLTLDGIESGRRDINIERFNLKELIDSIIRSNYIKIKQKDIKLILNNIEDAYVWYDQIHIEEVFSNFFVNALNHSTGSISVDMLKKDKILKITIFNTGDNIPETDIERIWDKFYKVDKARTREYGGNGIGLSIVKAVLDNYGMKYGVNNTNDGVIFWFELECE
jgi:signal transduction histidine kinase